MSVCVGGGLGVVGSAEAEVNYWRMQLRGFGTMTIRVFLFASQVIIWVPLAVSLYTTTTSLAPTELAYSSTVPHSRTNADFFGTFPYMKT